jgi:bacillithiol biosynthesis deacetylase BshB1
MSKMDILAFGAHPDDVELSCSGTLIKHIKAGMKVGIVDLTEGELGSRGSVDSRYEESARAMEILGVSVRENLKMPDGFIFKNKENLLKVIQALRKYQPKIVLANAISDRHTDHGKAADLIAEACFLSGLKRIETNEEGIAQEAFRPSALYHYIQDNYIDPDFVIDITPHFEQKMKSVLAYETQFYNPDQKGPKTPISGEDFLKFLEARAREMGRKIQSEFGEGFTKNRTIGVELLTDLV